jgi:hypothetical protein
MAMDSARTLFQDHFQILSRREGAYAVRFIAPPYTDDESSSELVFGHDRDPARISGPSIRGLLAKFKLEEKDFKEACNQTNAETR